MKKLVTVLLVFIIIFTAVGILYLVIRYYGSAAEEDNWFNNNYREKFVRYPIVRLLFNLHWDGDAKTDYLLADKFTSLRIEIDRYDECELTNVMINKIKSEIESIINKPGGVTIAESQVISLQREAYSRQQIKALASTYQNNTTKNNEAVLYILCLNVFDEEPTDIGLTVQEDGLAIFWEAIKKLTSNNTATFEAYVISTILHEFGHQLGLGHIESPHCLMSESIERPGNALGAVQLIAARYCPEELEAIEAIRQSLYN